MSEQPKILCCNAIIFIRTTVTTTSKEKAKHKIKYYLVHTYIKIRSTISNVHNITLLILHVVTVQHDLHLAAYNTQTINTLATKYYACLAAIFSLLLPYYNLQKRRILMMIVCICDDVDGLLSLFSFFVYNPVCTW